jgi:poly-gamma-glutamate synthesis protein (capsule biosynthesis protein)
VQPGDVLRLIDGRITSWRQLGVPGGAVRLYLGPEAAAGSAVWWLLSGLRPAHARIRSNEAAARAVARDPLAVGLVAADALGPWVRALSVGGTDPVREPARYPLRLPGEEPGPVTTAIGVGDILLSRTVHAKMVARNDFASPFRNTARRLAAAHLAFANFEGTLSRGARPLPGGTRFTATVSSLRGLTLAGLDVLSLANNHAGDYGDATLVETRALLRAAGIATVGTGANDAQARAPAIVRRNGVRFGFLSFNAIVGTGPPGPAEPGAVRIRMAPWWDHLDGADLEALTGAVRALRPRVDVVTVYPHWGTEYTNLPNDDQRRVAHALIDAGADLVVATHPHWVQGAEIYRGKLVAYSLGNFVFDQTWSEETQEGAALELVFWGSRLAAAEFVPVRIEDAHRPRFQSWSDGGGILRRIWSASGDPYGRAL